MRENPMNIVLVGPAYPLRGGNALFVAHLYEALSAQHRVTIISFSKLYPTLLFPGIRQNDVSGVNVKPCEAEPIIHCNHPWTWIRAARRIAELRPDLLVFNWWNPFFAPMYITMAQWTGKACPILFVVENLVSHEERLMDVLLTRGALRYADHFLVLSGTVREQLAAFFPDAEVYESTLPIYDCYNVQGLSSDEARRRLGLGTSAVMLFFGYVRAYKGLMTLIEVLPEVFREVDGRLLIVGEFYDDKQPYIEKMEALGIADKVLVVDRYVPNEEVELYFAAADVVVLPYVSATQSGILQIAYGFDKPVVVTDVGGLAEGVADGVTGYVVPPEDATALAGAICRYFREDKRSKFSANVAEYRRRNKFGNIPEIFDRILR